MPRTVVEQIVQSRRFGPKQRLRVDLHGVSTFGPGDYHALIRWEWIDEIKVDAGVVVSSQTTEVMFPAGAFGLEPEALAAQLREARSIFARADVIENLRQAALDS